MPSIAIQGTALDYSEWRCIKCEICRILYMFTFAFYNFPLSVSCR